MEERLLAGIRRDPLTSNLYCEELVVNTRAHASGLATRLANENAFQPLPAM